ncbi:Hypothetical predicted protein [Paramuricea clavata]|uniref:Uncharacterized protein n=1 Tax=Paramuricea clavata TaxID=317549 RepID=A0A6S7HBQ5_PARCT|nr:Hypothetical predicted protein [Paramuricea clavata]
MQFVFLRLEKSKSNDYRVAYSSHENLAEPSTTSLSENNPGGKVLSFTSLSSMPESKIDSKHVPDNTDHQSSQRGPLA